MSNTIATQETIAEATKAAIVKKPFVPYEETEEELIGATAPAFDATEKNDAIDMSIEAVATRAAKRQEKYQARIVDQRKVHVDAYSDSYHTKAGTEVFFDIEDCDPNLIMCAAMPNEPQLTATATESRGGSARLSDEG